MHKASKSQTKLTRFLQSLTLVAVLHASKNYLVPGIKESLGTWLVTFAFIPKGFANCDMQYLFRYVVCQQLVFAVDTRISFYALSSGVGVFVTLLYYLVVFARQLRATTACSTAMSAHDNAHLQTI